MIIIRRTLCGCEKMEKIPDEWHFSCGMVKVPLERPAPKFKEDFVPSPNYITEKVRVFRYRGTVNELGMPMYYEEAEE